MKNRENSMIRKTILGSLILLWLLSMAGCEDELYLGEVDCSTCYTEKPKYGDLIIQLSRNGENREIPLTVYRDEWEEGYIVWSDTVNTEEFYLEVEVNHYYSAVAEYRKGEKTIFAVDGDRFEIKKVIGQCDNTCWVYRGGELNVKLKY